MNNRNEPPKVDETGTKTSDSNSILESKEEKQHLKRIEKSLEIIKHSRSYVKKVFRILFLNDEIIKY